jgi:AcrR family transcriptional regulator
VSKNLSNPQDTLRVRRTHKLLWEAFLALLNERSFEEISVRDICEQAMVNRTTFYNHFESKHDLVEYGRERGHEMFYRKFHQARTSEEKMHVIVQAFEQIAARKHYYTYLFIHKGENKLSSLLHHQAAEQLEGWLAEQVQKNGCPLSIPLPIIAQFYAGTLFALATWWLENEMPISAEELAHYWFQLCQGAEPLPLL